MVRLMLSPAIAGCLAPASLVAQEPVIDTFRLSVDVVTVRASVRDEGGKLILGLLQRDFTVLDNGEQRPIRMFHADTAAPVTAAFLVDVSGSMSVATRWCSRMTCFSTP